MVTDPTNGELGRRLEDLAEQVATGFGGVHSRLDRVNEQLDRHSTTLGTHAVKLGEQGVLLDTLKRAVEHVEARFGELKRRMRGLYTSLSRVRLAGAAPDESKGITRREVSIGAAGFGAAITLFELLPRLLERMK